MLEDIFSELMDLKRRVSRLEDKSTQIIQLYASTTASKNTNINNAAVTAIDWNLGVAPEIGNIGTLFTHSTSVNPTRINITRKALLEINAWILPSSTVADVNVAIAVLLNGVAIRPSGYGYISAAAGHNFANSSVTCYCKANAGDYLEVITQQEAAAGTATLRDLSRIVIKEIFV